MRLACTRARSTGNHWRKVEVDAKRRCLGHHVSDLACALSPSLQSQKQTTVLPLLVGPLVKTTVGGGLGEIYDDFFSAGCLPLLPPIRVEKIDEGLQKYLGKMAPKSNPVDQVFKSLLELQVTIARE